MRSELGPTTILVTSAGLFGFAPFVDMRVEDWERVIAVNLTGTFHACQLAVPDMLAAGWGRIIMISSSSAQRGGSPEMAHYAASKGGGVLSLTRSLAREYAARGITVNNIPPSGIETPMQHQQQAAGILPSTEQMAANIPIGHLAPVTTSPRWWASSAPMKPASSPVKPSASTGGRSDVRTAAAQHLSAT